MKLVIGTEAYFDLELILQYSIETFGVVKAEEYNNSLYGNLIKLEKMPTIGHPHKFQPEDLRIYNVHSNAVVYKIDEESLTVKILRILYHKVNLTGLFE
jgi:plasmid stabilization system protein ParE